jgi:hypothetical protein
MCEDLGSIPSSKPNQKPTMRLLTQLEWLLLKKEKKMLVRMWRKEINVVGGEYINKYTHYGEQYGGPSKTKNRSC